MAKFQNTWRADTIDNVVTANMSTSPRLFLGTTGYLVRNKVEQWLLIPWLFFLLIKKQLNRAAKQFQVSNQMWQGYDKIISTYRLNRQDVKSLNRKLLKIPINGINDKHIVLFHHMIIKYFIL